MDNKIKSSQHAACGCVPSECQGGVSIYTRGPNEVSAINNGLQQALWYTAMYNEVSRPPRACG